MDVKALYREVLGDKVDDYVLPPKSFSVFDSEILEYNKELQSILVKMSVPEFTLNTYGTMQGGMIVAAADNAIGPLSLLVAPMNMTRRINTEYIRPIKPEVLHIYVRARLIEQKRKRLFSEASIEDEEGKLYIKVTAENWIIST